MTPQQPASDEQVRELRNRLEEAEETLQAIRNGEVDGLVVTGTEGEHVYTLEGADHPYRMMVEEMEEGAVTLSVQGIVLYCNRRFAEMLHVSQAQVLGAVISKFLSHESYAAFAQLIEECWCGSCAHGEVELLARDGALVPVSVACSALLLERNPRSISLVVTNLSARKAAEAAIQRMNQELEARVEERTAALASALTEQQHAEELIKRQREELRGLAVQLAQTQETERARIARELHDGIGQQLTVLSLNLNMIAHQFPDGLPPGVQTLLDRSLQIVETTGKSVRDVMADLRPPLLDDYGLVAALHRHGAQLARLTGLTIDVRATNSDMRLSADKEIALFRIAQEALINVVRHARATHVEITLTEQDAAVSLVITDDGIGFERRSRSSLRETPGWGLLSMRERSEAIDAHFAVSSAPGAGTTVRIEVRK